MNIADARDAMNAHAVAAIGAVPVTFNDVPAALRDGDTAWARITVKHVGGGKRGFGDGTSMYDSTGILSIEIFAQTGSGLLTGDQIAQIAKTYLENVRSSLVWYRNIRAVDIGRDGAFEKINILADFEYSDYH